MEFNLLFIKIDDPVLNNEGKFLHMILRWQKEKCSI